MFRKITFALTTLLTLSALAEGRTRSVGSSTSDAALLPLRVPGTTVSGVVSAVSGTIISLAGGLVTIDAASAKITDERASTGSIASIAPGAMIFAVLSSATVAPNAALPAALIAVAEIPQVTLNGPVQAVGTSTLTLLGRTIVVDANTSFGGRRVHGLADILPGDQVQVQANAVGGVLVATGVLVFPPAPRPSVVIHGTVKSIGTDSWVITDTAKKEWTIVVNAQTKIIGDPRVGDDVQILVNLDNANQYVAVSIMKALSAEPVLVFRGEVKSIGAASWVIRSSSGEEITVAINAQTKIIGDPGVNDGVQVAAKVDAAGNYTALSITKLGIAPSTVTLRGVVKSIVALMLGCPADHCGEIWTIGPEAGLGPDFLVRVNAQTKISGDPTVGDRVEVIAEPTSSGYLALSITRQ